MLPTEAQVIARACQGPPESARAVIARQQTLPELVEYTGGMHASLV